jgi:hypothetical protein
MLSASAVAAARCGARPTLRAASRQPLPGRPRSATFAHATSQKRPRGHQTREGHQGAGSGEAGAVPGHGGKHQARRAGQQQDGTGNDAHAADTAGSRRQLTQRLDRRDTGAGEGRNDSGHKRHADAHHQRGHHRARRHHGRRARDVNPDRVQQPPDAGGETDPGPDAEGGGDETEDESLGHHAGHHLAAGRTDRAQQGDLATALRKHDVEGVPDDKRSHQERHRGEREQDLGEDAETVADGPR